MSLTLLPIDLFFELVDELQPVDLLSIGQTCKHFHELASDPSIWERVIRTLCAERGLSPASYPFKDMNILDLQRAALAPWLWEGVLRRGSIAMEVFAEPTQARRAFFVSEPPSHEILELGEPTVGFDGLIPVPGGRFLLCTGFDRERVDDTVYVKVLDLGLPGQALVSNPRLVLRHRVPCPSGLSRPTHDTAPAVSIVGTSTLTVAVLVKPSIWCFGKVDSMVAVFSIDLGEPNPNFRILGSLRLTGLGDLTAESTDPIIYGDEMFLNLVDIYVVWNFRQSWYRAWNAEHDLHQDQVRTCTLGCD